MPTTSHEQQQREFYADIIAAAIQEGRCQKLRESMECKACGKYLESGGVIACEECIGRMHFQIERYFADGVEDGTYPF